MLSRFKISNIFGTKRCNILRVTFIRSHKRRGYLRTGSRNLLQLFLYPSINSGHEFGIDLFDSRQSVIGIELLAAAQGCDFHAPLRSSRALEAVRTLLRAQVPHLEDDRHFHPDMALAIGLVSEGEVVRAATLNLPEVA